MISNRETMLDAFLATSILSEKTSLSKAKLSKVRIGTESGDALVDVIRKLVSTFDTAQGVENIVLKGVNSEISKKAAKSNN